VKFSVIFWDTRFLSEEGLVEEYGGLENKPHEAHDGQHLLGQVR
jgi:hypothetical protein